MLFFVCCFDTSSLNLLVNKGCLTVKAVKASIKLAHFSGMLCPKSVYYCPIRPTIPLKKFRIWQGLNLTYISRIWYYHSGVQTKYIFIFYFLVIMFILHLMVVSDLFKIKFSTPKLVCPKSAYWCQKQSFQPLILLLFLLLLLLSGYIHMTVLTDYELSVNH